MFQTIRPKNQRPQLYRPGPTPNPPANQKPPGELGQQGNKCVEEGEGTERLAPPRVRRMSRKLTPPRPTLVRPEKPRKKPIRKPQRGDVGTVLAGGMLPKSRAITAIRRTIMLRTAISRKTNARKSIARPWRPMGWLPQVSHSRMREDRTEEMKAWPKPQLVRDIQFYRGLIADFIELQCYSPWYFKQLTNQLAISPRALSSRTMMYQVLVVLVVLVVLMELVEVTKICQVPRSEKSG